VSAGHELLFVIIREVTEPAVTLFHANRSAATFVTAKRCSLESYIGLTDIYILIDLKPLSQQTIKGKTLELAIAVIQHLQLAANHSVW